MVTLVFSFFLCVLRARPNDVQSGGVLCEPPQAAFVANYELLTNEIKIKNKAFRIEVKGLMDQ